MKSPLKSIIRILLALMGLLLLFSIFFLWLNLSKGLDKEKLIAQLPKNITPRYPADSAWWKETTIYQIYPRSYKDSDGDGLGDLAGIIGKLDYIKSLGFETIWLSPFFKSPQEDHGYDISDYRSVHDEYGDMYIVDSLIAEIHRRDMKVVFDLVLNHTSDQHPWFLESRSSKDNPKSEWYVWRDGKGDDPPNNWTNILGQSTGWNYVEERDQWYYAAFLPFQPDLNMSNPEVREAVFDMIRFWLDKGVDGFRLDIFNFIFENTDYPDNPFTLRYLPDFETARWTFQKHLYNFHQPEVVQFAKDLRSLLEQYPDGRFMVGEVFGSHEHMRELLGMEHYDGLNLVFLFDFLDAFEFSADYFYEKVKEYETVYPGPLIPTYVFSNHDQFRSITRLDNNVEKAEVLAAFQLTMRGVPFTYQGEEIGMKTADIPLEEAQDPLAQFWLDLPAWMRDLLPLLRNRDNVRTPMQWDGSPNAGFSNGEQTWLPVQEDYQTVNVGSKLADEQSLLHTYKELLKLRQQYATLKKGDVVLMDPETLPDGVLGYTRVFDGQAVKILLNFSKETREIELDGDVKNNILFRRRAGAGGSNVSLSSYGIVMFVRT